MGKFDQALLIRALNATRPYYFPSYVGLRLIADQLPGNGDGYLARMVIRRVNSGDASRFKHFKLYKGSHAMGTQIKHDYRSCVASSPTTAIAEAILLSFMSAEPAFNVSPRVYSYNWPKSRYSGGSYEFFASGYKKRNSDIAEALASGENCAVVMDMRSFYPSISSDMVRSSLTISLLAAATLKDSQDEVLNFFKQLMDASAGGVPIGPSAGHALGNLVLRQLDIDLSGRFGGRYFRYVDDIVVVYAARDGTRVSREVEEAIGRNGFNVNHDKTVVMSSKDWNASLMKEDVPSGLGFRELCRELPAYLAYFPTRADELRQMFVDAGLRIPFSRVLALSKFSRFKYFLRRDKSLVGIQTTWRVLTSNNNRFLSWGLAIKDAYEGALRELLHVKSENVSDLRRWQVQRARRLVNSLFYLRRFDEWSVDNSEFALFPELV